MMQMNFCMPGEGSRGVARIGDFFAICNKIGHDQEMPGIMHYCLISQQ
jgi:hypothetical protein